MKNTEAVKEILSNHVFTVNSQMINDKFNINEEHMSDEFTGKSNENMEVN